MEISIIGRSMGEEPGQELSISDVRRIGEAVAVE